MVEYKVLSTDSCFVERPRHKYQIGDKIVYFLTLEDAQAAASLKHEIDMMEKALKLGIPTPKVYSYTREGYLELAMLQFVGGELLSDVQEQDPERARKARQTLHDTLPLFLQSTSPTPLIPYPHVWMTRSQWDPYTGSRDFYAHHIYQILNQLVLRPQLKGKFSGLKMDWHKLSSFFPDEISVLCHGDLAQDNNVILAEDGGICLIDWELAGYYPLHVARWLNGEAMDATASERGVRTLCQTLKEVCFETLVDVVESFKRFCDCLVELGACPEDDKWFGVDLDAAVINSTS